ncbi:MAG: hypothetical protein ACREMY_12530 [bacterium]
MRRAPDQVYTYDAERARQANRLIRDLCEARGLDNYWILAHRLIVACEGIAGDAALRVLVEELKPKQRAALAKHLLEAARGR